MKWSASRMPLFVDAVAVTTHEIVPVRQLLALMDQAIGAGLWHPADFLDLLRSKNHAVFDDLLAIFVVGTLTVIPVKQAAMESRVSDLTGIFIFQFEQAAFATAVAEGFPFLR